MKWPESDSEGYGPCTTCIDLRAQLAAKDAELEQLRVQLAGCSVAAMGGTNEPAKPSDYGWSPAYQDTLDLRLKFENALRTIERLTRERDELREQVVAANDAVAESVTTCCWFDVGEMWESSCGVAWQFNDDGPAENGCVYCHKCGGKIEMRATESGHD